MEVIRIAGLMRSGTNLLAWVLRHNFAEVGTASTLLGWKHGPIYRSLAELDLEHFVDPRYRGELRAFVRDRPAEWARLRESALYRAAARAQREQSFGVALAVRDPRRWFASCLRVSRDNPGFLVHGMTPEAAAEFWQASHESWLQGMGERSVIVDTDRLRQEPESSLGRMASALRIDRLAGVRLPAGYLHPRAMDELYELLGAPEPALMAREITTPAAGDHEQQAQFMALLDRGMIERLGLGRYA
jgi:hypothetical protein